jgi:hypothetical protein
LHSKKVNTLQLNTAINSSNTCRCPTRTVSEHSYRILPTGPLVAIFQHSHSCSQKASKHTSGQSIVGLSMVTCHGISCIQPSATSLSSVLFVKEPALKLLPLDTRHLYSSQAGLQHRSSWPAHVFRSSSKCPIVNCSFFFFHRESHI